MCEERQNQYGEYHQLVSEAVDLERMNAAGFLEQVTARLRTAEPTDLASQCLGQDLATTVLSDGPHGRCFPDDQVAVDPAMDGARLVKLARGATQDNPRSPLLCCEVGYLHTLENIPSLGALI